MSARPDDDRVRLPILQEVGDELTRLFRAEEERAGRRRALFAPSKPVRSRVAGALLVVLIAATGAAAAVTLLSGRTAPVRTPGGGVLCPSGYGFLAFGHLGLVYPPNYPGPLPSNVRRTSCYASARDAAQAGFRLPQTPAGDVRLGALYLAPASAVVRRVCRAARGVIGAAVYCPRLLPAPWIDPANGVDEDCPSAGCGARLLSITGSFPAPISYIGFAPGEGNVTIWNVSLTQKRFYPYLVGCPSARPTARTSFRGHPAAWYSCSIYGRSTSTVLQWRIGRELYGISADGPAGQRRRLVTYIADHVEREPATRGLR